MTKSDIPKPERMRKSYRAPDWISDTCSLGDAWNEVKRRMVVTELPGFTSIQTAHGNCACNDCMQDRIVLFYDGRERLRQLECPNVHVHRRFCERHCRLLSHAVQEDCPDCVREAEAKNSQQSIIYFTPLSIQFCFKCGCHPCRCNATPPPEAQLK